MNDMNIVKKIQILYSIITHVLLFYKYKLIMIFLLGGIDQRHTAARHPRDDYQVHDRSDPHTGQARRVNPGRDQAVLRGRGARGVEVRHLVRPVRHVDDHPGGDILQYASQGRLADGEDAGGQLHGLVNARRHETGGERRHHERVPGRHESSPDHHGRVGARHRRTTGLARNQLRLAQQSRALHSSNRSIGTFWPQGCRHQLCHERRHSHSKRH